MQLFVRKSFESIQHKCAFDKIGQSESIENLLSLNIRSLTNEPIRYSKAQRKADKKKKHTHSVYNYILCIVVCNVVRVVERKFD